MVVFLSPQLEGSHSGFHSFYDTGGRPDTIFLTIMVPSLFLVEANEEKVNHSQAVASQIIVFSTFQVFGLCGSVFLLGVAMFSKRIVRHATWFSFIFSWILSSASYSLLLFSGEINNPRPDFGVCLTQALLVYAAPPLTAATTLGLVVKMWLVTRTVLLGDRVNLRGQRRWSVSILIFPYVVYAAIIIEVLAIGLHDPGSIKRTGSSGMYCNTTNPVPGRVSAGLVVLILVPTAILEALILNFLRKHWGAFKNAQNAKSMALRVVIFGVFGVFAVVMSTIFFFSLHRANALNIVVSTIPVAAVILFGTQKDLLQVYRFWRRSKLQDEQNGCIAEDGSSSKHFSFQLSPAFVR